MKKNHILHIAGVISLLISITSLVFLVVMRDRLAMTDCLLAVIALGVLTVVLFVAGTKLVMTR